MDDVDIKNDIEFIYVTNKNYVDDDDIKHLPSDVLNACWKKMLKYYRPSNVTAVIEDVK